MAAPEVRYAASVTLSPHLSPDRSQPRRRGAVRPSRPGAAIATGWLLLVVACAGAPLPRTAAPWPEADALFRRDPRWLGGDAVYSVDLGHDRILWLFGDSFVAPDGARDRRTATMVRNTLAVQQGRDPASASIVFHWRTADDGKPLAAFADDGAIGHWPLHGVRLAEGPLLVCLTRVRNTPGIGLGFAIDGWRLVCIDAPDLAPEAWRPRELACATTPAGVTFGTSVWCDGDHVVLLGTRGNGPHRGVLARFRRRDVTTGNVTLECWSGGRWTPASPDAPLDEVLADAGPECSLHRHGDGWLHTMSRGFGRTTIAVHTAPQATGPWSPLHDVFTPPECAAAQPFVYAGKAHPEMHAGYGWLAISYAANSFDFAELFTPAGQQTLYWPRFVRVPTAALHGSPTVTR